MTNLLDSDPRPMPTEAALAQLGHAVMTELLDTLLESPLEDHMRVVCEAVIGGFHSAVLRLERDGDRARDAVQAHLRAFDGSEVADTELQAATALSQALGAAAEAVALVRDAAAEAYAVATGEAWTAWRGEVRGSVVTAAQLEARTVLEAAAAERRRGVPADAVVVAFRGAPSAAGEVEAMRIFDALNYARAQHPTMVLATTGAPGAERLALSWARQKRVAVVLARPDFAGLGKAAPFRANDELMALRPVLCLTLAQPLDGTGAAFGPALNVGQKAQAAGIRHLAIRRRDHP